jgi:hypothetical protein
VRGVVAATLRRDVVAVVGPRAAEVAVLVITTPGYTLPLLSVIVKVPPTTGKVPDQE